MSNFKPNTRKPKTAAPETVTAEDLQRRCRAAARMALRGQNWSADQREDCASELVVLVWSRASEASRITSAPVTRRMSSVGGGERVTYSAKNAQKSLDRVPDAPGRTAAVPKDLCAFDFLVKRAADIRRSWEAQSERDHAAAVEAPVTLDPWTPAPADETGGTPWGARRSALDMLRALGMVGDRVAWGPLWTLAYAAARAVESTSADGTRGGLDRETVAAELELDPATVRQHIARAAARIPAAADAYGTRAAWADALNMPEGGIALKPSRSRNLSHDIGTRHEGPRDYIKPENHAPVTVRRNGPTRKPDAWARGAHLRPEWTRTLAPATAERLAAGARIRQERSAQGESAARR